MASKREGRVTKCGYEDLDELDFFEEGSEIYYYGSA